MTHSIYDTIQEIKGKVQNTKTKEIIDQMNRIKKEILDMKNELYHFQQVGKKFKDFHKNQQAQLTYTKVLDICDITLQSMHSIKHFLS